MPRIDTQDADRKGFIALVEQVFQDRYIERAGCRGRSSQNRYLRRRGRVIVASGGRVVSRGQRERHIVQSRTREADRNGCCPVIFVNGDVADDHIRAAAALITTDENNTSLKFDIPLSDQREG